METWFAEMGNFYAATGVPALAADLALNGPPADQVGYRLAYKMQRAPEEIDLYPPQELIPGG